MALDEQRRWSGDHAATAMMDELHLYFLLVGHKAGKLTRFKRIVPDEGFHAVTVSVPGMDEVEEVPGRLS